MLTKNTLFKLSALILLLILSVVYCFSYSPKSAKVYIFQTSDIHAGGKRGGLKNFDSLSTYLSLLLKKYDKDEYLLIDCGDLFQGSFEGAESHGRAVISAVNNLEYSAFIPGNHDFDFGREAFIKNIDNLNCDVIAANLWVDGCDRILPWKVYIRSGKKIVLIGMTSPYIDYWLFGNKYEGIVVKPIVNSLRKVMPEVLKTEPDLIVLAVHQGLYQAKRYPTGSNLFKIVRNYPQINIVFGGHTHTPVPGKIIGRDTIYIQPGYHGRYISSAEVDFTNEPPTVFSSLLKVKSIGQRSSGNLYPKYDIGFILRKLKLKDMKSLSYFLSEQICTIMKSKTGSCVAIYPSMHLSVSKKQKISLEKLAYLAAPYEDNLISLNIDGAQLKEALRELNQYALKRRKKFNFATDGLEIKFKGRKIDKVFIVIENKKYPIKKEQMYKVAISSFEAAGAGNRYPVLRKLFKDKSTSETDSGILIRTLLLDYLKSRMN